jgi:hypothetical protein
MFLFKEEPSLPKEGYFMITRHFPILATAALTLAVVSAAPADTRAETSTYVDGNLTGMSPNTGGTLLLSDDKAMYFRTGLSNVPVPYANISTVELGATRETSHGTFVHKRKTETQLLIVTFKNDEGQEKNMTLELAKVSAPGVLSAIQSHGVTPQVANTEAAGAPANSFKTKPEPKKDEKMDVMKTATNSEGTEGWWGDGFWKTSRNADKWTAKTGTSSANDQR